MDITEYMRGIWAMNRCWVVVPNQTNFPFSFVSFSLLIVNEYDLRQEYTLSHTPYLICWNFSAFLINNFPALPISLSHTPTDVIVSSFNNALFILIIQYNMYDVLNSHYNKM